MTVHLICSVAKNWNDPQSGKHSDENLGRIKAILDNKVGFRGKKVKQPLLIDYDKEHLNLCSNGHYPHLAVLKLKHSDLT